MMKQRRFDIDWLRVGAMLVLFFFHNARFFDYSDWHLKNPDKSLGFTIFYIFISQWIMPLFFLLSGSGSWFALEFKNSKSYIIDRIKRLLVPYYLVGFLVLIPPQYYFEQASHGRFVGNFFQLIPQYFNLPYKPQLFGFYLGFHPNFLAYWGGHLWFLRYLFMLSFISLPVMLYLKSESGRKLISKIANLCCHRGGILLFLIPIALTNLALRPVFPDYLSWADFALWLVCFLIGYLIPADDRFNLAIKKNSWISLVLGLFAFAGGLLVYVLKIPAFSKAISLHAGYNISYSIYLTLGSVIGWCWLAFILSIGAKFLNFNNRLLSYGNEAVLPFYILHQTIILSVGYFVIQSSLNCILKYIVISSTSFILIILIYELLIRRFNIMRFLFGMKKHNTQMNGTR